MKRLILVLTVLTGVGSVRPQEGPANEWASMSHQSKVVFASGINIGLATSLHMECGKRVDPNADLVKELDKFYEVQSNWRAPLEIAVMVVLIRQPQRPPEYRQ